MKKAKIKQPKSKNEKSITSDFIILLLSAISLFLESIIIIIGSFKKGFLKKEVLSKDTNLGFDLIIKKR
tara:strand:- start:2676 stop:2882 length:207 start_codon:yes stop_codon:yes gene_type:complete